jgi:hypothetical protein
MGTGTGFDANKTGRQFGEEPDDFRPPQLPLHYNLALGIYAVELEQVLGNIEADRPDRFNLAVFHHSPSL